MPQTTTNRRGRAWARRRTGLSDGTSAAGEGYRGEMWLFFACAEPEPPSKSTTPADYQQLGPASVGVTTVALADPSRPLNVSVWYPSAADSAPSPITSLYPDPEESSLYQGLLDVAPAGCPGTTTSAGLDAPAATADAAPLLILSHCLGCTRGSLSRVAEHLVSWGFVVMAPDHAGNTLFDTLAGVEVPLDDAALALRVEDLGRVLDEASTIAADRNIKVDPDQIGLMGHSFGAISVAALLRDRGARLPTIFVAAPPGNPLVGDVDMSLLEGPMLFYVMAEDHSVGLVGNLLMDQNRADAPGPSWRVELPDGGHWSPSDLVGLTDNFMPGCGEDTRETGGEPFAYPDPATARALSGAVAAAFFRDTIAGDPSGAAWLQGAPAPLLVEPP